MADPAFPYDHSSHPPVLHSIVEAILINSHPSRGNLPLNGSAFLQDSHPQVYKPFQHISIPTTLLCTTGFEIFSHMISPFTFSKSK
jgi:hypothetical protein